MALTGGAAWILTRGTESISIADVVRATSVIAKLFSAYVICAVLLRIAGNLSERRRGRTSRLGTISRRASGPAITWVVDALVAMVVSLTCLAGAPTALAAAPAAATDDRPVAAATSSETAASVTPPAAGIPAPAVDAWLAGEHLASPRATAPPETPPIVAPPRPDQAPPSPAETTSDIEVRRTPARAVESAAPSRAAPPPPVDEAAANRGETESIYVVRSGDSLWRIAARQLGPGASPSEIDRYWRRIYSANEDAIGGNPSLIQPGLELALPPAESLAKAGGA